MDYKEIFKVIQNPNTLSIKFKYKFKSKSFTIYCTEVTKNNSLLNFKKSNKELIMKEACKFINLLMNNDAYFHVLAENSIVFFNEQSLENLALSYINKLSETIKNEVENTSKNEDLLSEIKRMILDDLK